MTRHRCRNGTVFALLIGLGSSVIVAANPSPIAKVTWLAGCWADVRGEKAVEEQWMAPRAGTMLGMGRTVSGQKVREFEFMWIHEEEGQLVYTARPSGQGEAAFRSIEITDTGVVFENATHDFPQRIIYRKQPDGSLIARIEGKQGEKVRGIDYPMRRAACPPVD